jgi:hypothetical protein
MKKCRTAALGGSFAGEGAGATFSYKAKALVFTGGYEILPSPTAPSE